MATSSTLHFSMGADRTIEDAFCVEVTYYETQSQYPHLGG